MPIPGFFVKIRLFSLEAPVAAINIKILFTQLHLYAYNAVKPKLFHFRSFNTTFNFTAMSIY